jgi:hypothetical protein
MAKWARIYRTYSYIDKNPVIDKVRTLVQDEGLFNKLGIVHEISNVSKSTLVGWFHGSVKHPQHHTVAAVVSALGYEEAFVKKKDLDIERERKIAADWTAKQTKRPKKRSK